MYTCPKCGRKLRGPGRHVITCGATKTVVFQCERCERQASVEVEFSIPARRAPLPAGWSSPSLCECCQAAEE